MAVIKPKEEEQTQQGEPVIGTAAPAPQTQTAQAGVASAQGSEPKGSGSFTNLSKFIEANKGKSEQYAAGRAEATKKLGTDALSTLGAEESEATSRFTVPKYEQGSLSGMSNEQIKGLEDAYTVDEKERQAYKTPFTSDKGETQITQANQDIQGTNTLAGLGKVVGKGYETAGLQGGRGVQSFDSFLLRRDPAAQGKFETLRNWAAGKQPNDLGLTEGVVKAAAGRVAEAGTKALGQAENVQTALRGDVASAQTGLINPAQQSADRLNKQYSDLVKQYGADGTKSFINPDATALKRSDYIGQGTQASALGQISDADLARLNALETLAGKDLSRKGAAYVDPTFDQARWDRDVAVGQDFENRYITERNRVEAEKVAAADKQAGIDAGPIETGRAPVKEETPELIEAASRATPATDPLAGMTPQQKQKYMDDLLAEGWNR